MKISFDLDNTLIPFRKEDFDTEVRQPWQRLFNVSLMRSGTAGLFQALENRGHRVGVYTTSFRSHRSIMFNFYTYDIRPTFIINQQLSRPLLDKQGIPSSKYPPLFNIDLHVDDSLGVYNEGQKYGFDVFVVSAKDRKWSEKLLNYIEANCSRSR